MAVYTTHIIAFSRICVNRKSAKKLFSKNFYVFIYCIFNCFSPFIAEEGYERPADSFADVPCVEGEVLDEPVTCFFFLFGKNFHFRVCKRSSPVEFTSFSSKAHCLSDRCAPDTVHESLIYRIVNIDAVKPAVDHPGAVCVMCKMRRMRYLRRGMLIRSSYDDSIYR